MVFFLGSIVMPFLFYTQALAPLSCFLSGWKSKPGEELSRRVEKQVSLLP